MAMLAKPELMMRGATALAALLPQSVFATSLYTGNSGAQTITNGLDLAGFGGLVWTKCRSTPYDHGLFDTHRGVGNYLVSSTTAIEANDTDTLSAFRATGYVVGTKNFVNQLNQTFASWSFRKAPKFFDIVTYTGDGTSGRQIAHNLGIAPGMVIVKARSVADNWRVFHRSCLGQYLALNNTNAADIDNGNFFGNGNGSGAAAPTATTFTVNSQNAAGVTYVAYLFGNDLPSDPNGIVQCGSFTTDASGNASVNLGWSPQWVLVKCTTQAGNWFVLDASRGWSSGNDQVLLANTSGAEIALDLGAPTATGLSITGMPASNTYVYLAIRAPIFLGATRPQDAFATSLYTGTSANQSIVNGLNMSGAGALAWIKRRQAAAGHMLFDTTRGAGKSLTSNLTDAEGTDALNLTAFNANGFSLGTDANIGSVNVSGSSFAAWSFVKKPKFFDCVTYTGDGTSGRQIPHALGVAPGMVIVKRRDAASDWPVAHRSLDNSVGNGLLLQSTNASGTLQNYQGGYVSAMDAATFTLTQFTSLVDVNTAGGQYVAYLWAHDPSADGIVQAGSFTTDASANATVSLGWRPQFVLIKNTSGVGQWDIHDTTRGWGATTYYLRPSSSNEETSSTGSTSGAPTASGFTATTWDAGVYPSSNHVYLAIRAPTT